VARSTPARVAWTVVGLAGFGGIVALTYTLSGTAAFAYRGGFLLSALSAAAIILGAVCVTGGPIARFLSLRPLVWMGTVSYGAYLWHYPVFIELDAGRTGLTGMSLLAVRTVATFGLAAASYYLVERPVMEGVFWKSVKATGPALVAMAVTVAVVVAGTTTVASAGVSTTVPVRSTRSIRAALPRAVHARLESAGAFTTDPIRFLLLGDSLAVTLSVGLAAGSVHAFGTQVIDQGSFGCDYDTSVAISGGQHVVPLNDCLRWRTLYADEIARSHPDVVGLLTGRWSITDRVVGGQIVHVGQPAWDVHLVSEYSYIVRFLARQGVGVVLFTLPYFAPPQEAPDGSIFPENRPDRVVAFNRDLARVAAASRGKVTLMDLTALLSPHGHFQTVVDGVVVRWPDGVHVTPAGGSWLQPRVLPTVAELGLTARSGSAR